MKDIRIRPQTRRDIRDALDRIFESVRKHDKLKTRSARIRHLKRLVEACAKLSKSLARALADREGHRKMGLAKRLGEQSVNQRISEDQADQVLEARSEMWSGKGQGWLFSNVSAGSPEKSRTLPQEDVADGR